jgi:hypothetical protein
MNKRLRTVEAVLRTVYGDGVLGRAKPVQPSPQPERVLRPVATLRL